MTIHGAVIIEQGVTFAIVAVWPDPRRLDSLNERKLFKS